MYCNLCAKYLEIIVAEDAKLMPISFNKMDISLYLEQICVFGCVSYVTDMYKYTSILLKQKALF